MQKTTFSIMLSTTFVLSFSLFLTACSNLAVAGISNCKPATKQYKKTRVLDEATSQTVAKTARVNPDEVAVVFVVDRSGKVKTIVPTNKATSGAKRCDFNFPLKADTIKDLNTVDVFATTNPKVCWRNSSGTEECVVW
jgi:hypothetical protein